MKLAMGTHMIGGLFIALAFTATGLAQSRYRPLVKAIQCEAELKGNAKNEASLSSFSLHIIDATKASLEVSDSESYPCRLESAVTVDEYNRYKPIPYTMISPNEDSKYKIFRAMEGLSDVLASFIEATVLTCDTGFKGSTLAIHPAPKPSYFYSFHSAGAQTIAKLQCREQ